jgi:hypothetical protein
MLIKPEPSGSTTDAFRAGLPAFLSGPNFGGAGEITRENHIGGPPVLPGVSDFGGAGPWDHDPQQVFTLSLNDLASGAGTAAAKSVAWRFFAGTVPAKTVLGHCSQDAMTGLWKLTDISYGDRVWNMLDASQRLDNHSGVPQGNTYTLRVLTIPGLLVEAFWLVAGSAGDDLVVVFPAPPHQLHRVLNAQAVYPMPVFLNIIAGLARARLTYTSERGY